jgi:hypothetical protein
LIMPDIALGTVEFVDDAAAGRCTAYWHAAGGGEAAFLCSVALGAHRDPEVSTKFRELAAAVAGYFVHGSPAVSAVKPEPWYASLPCASCAAPQATEVMGRARQCSEAGAMQATASGVPLGCCRLRVVGVMRGDAGASSAPARRVGRRY